MQLRAGISLLLLSLLLLGCTAASRYRLDVSKHYMPQQWMAYDEASTKKHSGYNMIQQAMMLNKTLDDVLDVYGKPDYVRAASRKVINLAYLEKGVVLVFSLARDRTAPRPIEYQRFNNLSQKMVKEFQKYQVQDQQVAGEQASMGI